MSHEYPDAGEVYAVRGSASIDAPSDPIRYDIVVQFSTGPVLFENQRPANPHPAPYDASDPQSYDIIPAPVGTPVAIQWRGEEPRFWVPWLPAVEDCV